MSETPPGQASESTRGFELSGGDLALDFANTWGDRGRPDSDRLRSWADLLAFARQARALPPAVLDGIAARAAADPATAQEAFAAARATRDALYGLFADAARGRQPAGEHLATLNGQLAAALPHLQLDPSASGYAWRWDGDDDPTAPLRPVVRAAAELLASGDLARVRECDGATCTWLFLDRSRNRSRRWCDMESCGNRAKAARHYHRRRAGA